MPSASIELIASPRPAVSPQAKDVKRPATGFASMVDDTVAAPDATALTLPPRIDLTPRKPSVAEPNGSNTPDAALVPQIDQFATAALNLANPATSGTTIPNLSANAPVGAVSKPLDQNTTTSAENATADASASDPATASPDSSASTPAPLLMTPVAAILPAVSVTLPPQAPQVSAAPATNAITTTKSGPAPLALAAAALSTAKAADTADVSAPSDNHGDTDISEPDAVTSDQKAIPQPQNIAKPAVAAVANDAANLVQDLPNQAAAAAPAAATPQVVMGKSSVAIATNPTSKPDSKPETPVGVATPKDGTADDAQPVGASAAPMHDHRVGTATATLSVQSIADTPSVVTLPANAHTAGPASSAAQLTATVAPATPVPLDGIAVELASRAQGGSSRFDIRLDPAELGRIDVRIDIDKHGQMTSHLTVEKPETLAMLRQDSPQLQRALNDAGLKTTDSSLQFSLGDQSQPRQHTDGGERQSQRFIIRDNEISTPPPSIRTYGRMTAARSGVDISV